MPIHSFLHEESGETIDVYVPASAPSKDHQVQKQSGKVYRRIYAAPRAARDLRVTDASKEEFRRITDKNGIKQGELWELSREMSQRRAEKNGTDPVREKFYRQHEREYGVKHHEEVKEQKRQKAREIAARLGLGTE